MVRKQVFCSLALAVLFCLAAVGCSDDTSRVVSPGTADNSDLLATDSDWPDGNLGMEEYIAQGYYDINVESDLPEDDWGYTQEDPDEWYDDYPGSDKPIDNGLGKE